MGCKYSLKLMRNESLLPADEYIPLWSLCICPSKAKSSMGAISGWENGRQEST